MEFNVKHGTNSMIRAVDSTVWRYTHKIRSLHREFQYTHRSVGERDEVGRVVRKATKRHFDDEARTSPDEKGISSEVEGSS